MTSPILKYGDIVASGTSYFDDKLHEYHLKYVSHHDNRCIVPKEVVADLQRLGIELEHHWNGRIQLEGHRSSHYIDYDDGQKPVSPHVKEFLGQEITNREFKYTLEEEYL